MQQHIEQILHDMDILRPFVLANQSQNAELRSIMRRIIQHVEFIQNTPNIPPEQYSLVSNGLIQLLDAEHGALLKRNPESLLSEQEQTQLNQHIMARRQMLQSLQYDWPILQHALRSSYELLGKTPPNHDDIRETARDLERFLREHLQHDMQLHNEVNQLITALKTSMDGMLSVLQEVGDEAPEIKQAQHLLSQKLPSDPNEARSILQQACAGILSAGNKLSTASRTMHEQMQQQQSQMSKLTKHLKTAEAEARNDPLTGLANRRKLAEFLSTLPTHMPTSFIMIDIDHFKHINDRYGHDTGDDILKALASMLNESTRSSDMVARLGGEEFCIILPGAAIQAAEALAANLCQSVAIHEFLSKDTIINLTISLGVSQKKESETAMESIKRSDHALYQAKENGRNQWIIAK
ncbi:MAG: GGDEF domain-containing protein [Mariprofundaceae bacterium]|nr:GGDEF domain-containing protein [Mariprofundaceae bacterium]